MLWCNLSNGEEILARLGHRDVNTLDSLNHPVENQLSDAKFEAALYEVLLPESSEIKVAPLLYNRIPRVVSEPSSYDPTDILGRRFCVFEAPEGTPQEWHDLEAEDKVRLNPLTLKSLAYGSCLPRVDSLPETGSLHACQTLQLQPSIYLYRPIPGRTHPEIL